MLIVFLDLARQQLITLQDHRYRPAPLLASIY